MELIFSGDEMPQRSIISNMEAAAKEILKSHDITNDSIEISVSFVDENEIKELNSLYRETDTVTDVLSFPQFEDQSEIPQKGPVVLGDVVICNQRARQQAEEYGHSSEREFVYLFVHSILHLLGYDHMNDEEKQKMRQAEEDIMQKIGLIR